MIASPPVSVAVSPSRVVLAAGESRELRLANGGTSPATVDVGTAGYTLGLRGRMRILAPTRAVAVEPRRVVVPARGTTTVVLRGAARRAGDTPALVLLTTQRPQSDIAVRVRLGVVVLVRGAGRTVHHVVVERLRVHGRRLQLWLRNRGNAAEALRVRIRIGRAVLVDTRQLLPRSRGLSEFRLTRRVRGDAHVEVAFAGQVLRRVLRL
ncbi:MAG TPA: hypothetical protein VFA56_13190 [Gaiellaceae bacterium]|nr:hypothetical protein [Gaiellaceae bacterium]